ncbi:MAG: helix-turn-helix transcriptional regulator [Clostridia bacterium]|nr:helix-turn-helix transcriptional regulator [Clostridia bacterium]
MTIDVFKLGYVEMLLLFLLKDHDAHGYQLVQMLEERSGGVLTMKAAFQYPVLNRLMEDGYISGKEVYVERKTPSKVKRPARMRFVYHLEPSGHKRLNDLLMEHKAFTEACNTVFRI